MQKLLNKRKEKLLQPEPVILHFMFLFPKGKCKSTWKLAKSECYNDNEKLFLSSDAATVKGLGNPVFPSSLLVASSPSLFMSKLTLSIDRPASSWCAMCTLRFGQEELKKQNCFTSNLNANKKTLCYEHEGTKQVQILSGEGLQRQEQKHKPYDFCARFQTESWLAT